MIRGQFRTSDPWLGEGVRVHPTSGDAAPFLPRDLYEKLGGQPAYSDLPTEAEFESRKVIFK